MKETISLEIKFSFSPIPTINGAYFLTPYISFALSLKITISAKLPFNFLLIFCNVFIGSFNLLYSSSIKCDITSESV